VSALPPRLRYAAASGGGAAWYAASPAQRRAALENYAAVLRADPGSAVVRRTAREAFRNYGRMLADFVLMGRLSKEEVVERNPIDGVGEADRILAGGRGIVLAVPHMGSWDLAGSATAARGYPLSAVAQRFPGSLNAAVVATRSRFGLSVIPLGRAAVRAVRERLEAGGIVALLSDIQHGPGVEVSFFGRRAIVPGGPATFALRTGAALVTAHSYRTAPGRYRAVLDGEVEIQRGSDDRTTVRAGMQQVVHRFEHHIRTRPSDWYAFRKLFLPD
jgi:KDO2-lipid IV(A) lauroyltransferase